MGKHKTPKDNAHTVFMVHIFDLHRTPEKKHHQIPNQINMSPPKNWTISKGTFIFQPLTSWWFFTNPNWTICIKLGSSSPNRGFKKKWHHHPWLIFSGFFRGFRRFPHFSSCQVSGVNISGPKALRSWVSSFDKWSWQIGSVQLSLSHTIQKYSIFTYILVDFYGKCK